MALRGIWKEESMASAVQAVLSSGMSQKKAASTYGVPRGTLQRHIKNAENGHGIQRQLGRHCILLPKQEKELVDKLLDIESRLYGLTKEDVRKLVFQFCELNEIKHPFSKEEKKAGRKWMIGFFKRHKELSVRLKEHTALSRATGFKKQKVEMFFNLLQSTVSSDDGSGKIPLENIYKVNETVSKEMAQRGPPSTTTNDSECKDLAESEFELLKMDKEKEYYLVQAIVENIAYRGEGKSEDAAITACKQAITDAMNQSKREKEMSGEEDLLSDFFSDDDLLRKGYTEPVVVDFLSLDKVTVYCAVTQYKYKTFYGMGVSRRKAKCESLSKAQEFARQTEVEMEEVVKVDNDASKDKERKNKGKEENYLIAKMIDMLNKMKKEDRQAE